MSAEVAAEVSTEARAPDRSGFGKLWAILTQQERRQLGLLGPAVVLMAVLETASVAAIGPFLALLSNPDAIHRSRTLSSVYAGFDFASKERFFFSVGVFILVLMTVSNMVSAATTWSLLRFSWLRNHTLSTRLLASYLARPYSFFLNKNTADLGKNILSEVQQAVTGVLVQGIQLTAKSVTVLFVGVALLLLDPLMALGVSVCFGLFYGGLFMAVRRHTTRTGKERIATNGRRYKLASEALSGAKELKLYGLEDTVVGRYAAESLNFSTLTATNAVIAQTPKFALETIAFGGVLLMILNLLERGRDLHSIIPVLGLYAFAAYRLLPSLQTVFAGVTSIRFNLSALDMLYQDLCHAPHPASSPSQAPLEPLPFEQELRLERVSYTYPGAPSPSLVDVDFRIVKGSWVALAGPTGAGKSTLVDVILGLLQASGGRVVVDGRALGPSDVKQWQRNTAYVPQQIFLVDDTIARNICFGLADDAIDVERLRWAADVAQIHEFISSELPLGYETKIGDRGVRLSGGQRQRLGIARALYRRPALLVLDEATSALDTQTETTLFARLHAELSCSVLSIAHRVGTMRGFDHIYQVRAGRVVGETSFSQLMADEERLVRPGQEIAS